MTQHPFRLAEVALVGIAAVWGVTFVMVQDAIRYLPVMTFLAFRFLPASLLVALIFRRQLYALPAAGWRAGTLMGLFLTAGYVTQTLGLERTSAANAGFITGLFVVLTPLFGAAVLRHAVGWFAWLAAGASALGLYLLSGSGDRLHLAGDGLVLLCACAFAWHVLVTGRAVERHHVGALLAVQLGVCGIVCLAVATGTGALAVPRGLSVWSALLVTSLIASALGFFVQTYAQQHTSPTRTALILASEPAFAGLSSYVLQGTRLSVAGWAGAGLIMASILAVEVIPRLRPPRPLPEG